MATERHGAQFLLGLIIAIAVLVGFIFLPELNAIVLGISFAVFFYPLYAWLKKSTPNHDWLAAGFVVLLAAIIVLAPLIFFGLKLFQEAQALYKNVSTGGGSVPVIDFFRVTLAKFFPQANINFNAYVQQLLGIFINNLGPIFTGVAGVVATFLLALFALYYVLKDGSKMRAGIIAHSPLPARKTEEVLIKLGAMTNSIIRGSLFVSILYGVLVGLGFFVFGLPSAVLWGAVTVIAAFIPMVGVLLIVVPGIVSLWIGGNIIGAIGLVAWTFVMSTLMENFLRPWLIGRGGNIHPLLMLFAVLGGLSFFGPIGILLGPLVLGLFLALLAVYPIFANPKAK